FGPASPTPRGRAVGLPSPSKLENAICSSRFPATCTSHDAPIPPLPAPSAITPSLWYAAISAVCARHSLFDRALDSSVTSAASAGGSNATAAAASGGAAALPVPLGAALPAGIT